MSTPKVSIIAISYNHTLYLEEALTSILQQTYPNIELIIIDDASTDDSVLKIEKFLQTHTFKFPVVWIKHTVNQGNCKSFNEGFALSSGKYIIDFALDDVMLPQRIAQQVDFFEKQSESVGIIFTNAQLINGQGAFLKYHYSVDNQQKTLQKPPQGKVFVDILQKYFICPPTMMFSRTLVENLKGYDETLAYEDFDFWIRASQSYEFAYLDEVTTLYRRTSTALSQQFYQNKNNPLLASTLRVLEKASGFCKNDLERKALAQNAQYHLRQCFFTENFTLMVAYADFLERNLLTKYLNFSTKFSLFLGKKRLKISKLYQIYKNIRYANP
jgi:glycosyltransferase involved in cell wall biosynthesis